ncbi:MAG: superinfection exclusion B family protein [Parvibaculum sp.]|nr:superinfection exclusion B family protein [Parvibaculum sp.]
MGESIKAAVEALIDALRSPILLATVTLVCAIVLYLPPLTFAATEMSALKTQYGHWFLLAGLLSSIGLAIHVLSNLPKLFKSIGLATSRHLSKYKTRSLIRNALEQEKLLMAAFAAVDYTSINLNMDHPVVRSLYKKGILVGMTYIANGSRFEALCLSTETEQYLKKNGALKIPAMSANSVLDLLNDASEERYAFSQGSNHSFQRAPNPDGWMRV